MRPMRASDEAGVNGPDHVNESDDDRDESERIHVTDVTGEIRKEKEIGEGEDAMESGPEGGKGIEIEIGTGTDLEVCLTMVIEGMDGLPETIEIEDLPGMREIEGLLGRKGLEEGDLEIGREIGIETDLGLDPETDIETETDHETDHENGTGIGPRRRGLEICHVNDYGLEEMKLRDGLTGTGTMCVQEEDLAVVQVGLHVTTDQDHVMPTEREATDLDPENGND